VGGLLATLPHGRLTLCEEEQTNPNKRPPAPSTRKRQAELKAQIAAEIYITLE
jgi:hypothetical protein